METEMIVQLVLLFALMFLLMFARIPIFMALVGSVVLFAFIYPGLIPLPVFTQSLAQGIGSETFLALVFYFLMGEVMNRGGIGDSLFGFLDSAIGWIRGGMSHANILESVIFAGVSGSANADAAAMGSIMIPAMKKQGYPAGYAAAITEVTCVFGPIIPPSGGLVMLAVYMNCSARSMLVAGLIPGLTMCISMLALSYAISVKRHFPRTPWQGWKNLGAEFKKSFWALALPAGTIICLMAGIGTVTEVGALSAFFALVISKFAYRHLSFKEMAGCFINATVMSARVLCSIATAGVFTWLISYLGVSGAVADMISNASTSPQLVLILCVIILFIAGGPLSVNVLLTVFIPVMIPTVLAMGIDPFHFGIVAMLVCQLGSVTPPVGNLIYMTSAIAECSTSETNREALPYLILLLLLIIVWIFVPQICTFLPNLLFS